MAGAIGGLKGFWSWYQGNLAKQPVRTQMISSGILWAVGDVMAQSIEMKIQRNQIRKATSGSPVGTKSSNGKARLSFPLLGDRNMGMRLCQAQGRHSSTTWTSVLTLLQLEGLEGSTAAVRQSLDLARTCTTSLFGFGFVGPVGHYWYEALEYVVKSKMKLIPNSIPFITTKVFADTGLFGPIHLVAFFTYSGLMNGKPFETVKRDLGRDFLPTYMTEGTMWFLVQIANFRFVPVQHQLLFVNFVCILDSAFLSWVKHQEDAPWKRWLTSLVTPKSVKEE